MNQTNASSKTSSTKKVLKTNRSFKRFSYSVETPLILAIYSLSIMLTMKTKYTYARGKNLIERDSEKRCAVLPILTQKLKSKRNAFMYLINDFATFCKTQLLKYSHYVSYKGDIPINNILVDATRNSEANMNNEFVFPYVAALLLHLIYE